ncbi:MAG: hypothetical protein FK734_00355 [Asgard group archaeon]|nr:hypothetical protein [Asgard group archaeon]
MKEGKLPLDFLEELLNSSEIEINGLIQGPKIGCDVAVFDYYKAIMESLSFYNSDSPVYIVYKTDPITFPTSNPGRYSVIVNANDIVTSGAIPYGFNATIILPVKSTKEDIKKIQTEIKIECHKNKIAILGGHTEISSAVNTPIVSGAMIGFVPKDYYVSRTISEDDVILCVGYCVKEGMGIIASEGFEKLVNQFSKDSLEKLIKLGSDISIIDIALSINKKSQPGLMHDATEGGVLGAIYETIVPENFGFELYSEKFPLTKETIDICEFLGVNPLRVISSGTLIVVTTSSKAAEIMKLATDEIPIEIVGKIASKNKATIDGEPLAPPGPDAIISALRKINES